MACCLTAPSHYLKQYWLIIIEVLRHSFKGNFTGNMQDINPWYEFESYKFEIIAISLRGQWVKYSLCSRDYQSLNIEKTIEWHMHAIWHMDVRDGHTCCSHRQCLENSSQDCLWLHRQISTEFWWSLISPTHQTTWYWQHPPRPRLNKMKP